MDMEQCMSNFLLVPSRSSKGKGQSGVGVCVLLMMNRGLGIRRLEHFNSALLVSHIWNLLSLKESLWVKWVHAYKLNGNPPYTTIYSKTSTYFWDVPSVVTCHGCWRNYFAASASIRDSLWQNELASRVSPRDIHRVGLTLYSQVGDVIRDGDGDWVWGMYSARAAVIRALGSFVLVRMGIP
ncbi:hypothetical protein Tco_1246074 [Tanacetum coccineum]